jgi:tetratricopeptide (TPR) repeat protein
VMRGVLSWRQGEWDDAAKYFRSAYELGDQVGRSEVAFTALQWLAATLRESGDLAGAETELSAALDICERAGLIAQSIEAISARAVILALQGRHEQARAAAEEAERLAGRLHYPVGEAAMAEAAGATLEDADQAAARMEEARAKWLELGRPLDAARCLVVRGRLLRDSDPDAAARNLDAAAEEYERLGAPALAERARQAVRA